MHLLIVAEAQSWLGTKFQHQGRVKINGLSKGGCDCLGMVIGIAKSLKIKALDGSFLADHDQLNYSHIITSNILKDKLDILLTTKDIENLLPGDLILLKMNSWAVHLAIINSISPVTIIHSYAPAKKVVLQHLPNSWEIAGVYQLF